MLIILFSRKKIDIKILYYILYYCIYSRFILCLFIKYSYIGVWCDGKLNLWCSLLNKGKISFILYSPFTNAQHLIINLYIIGILICNKCNIRSPNTSLKPLQIDEKCLKIYTFHGLRPWTSLGAYSAPKPQLEWTGGLCPPQAPCLRYLATNSIISSYT